MLDKHFLEEWVSFYSDHVSETGILEQSGSNNLKNKLAYENSLKKY